MASTAVLIRAMISATGGGVVDVPVVPPTSIASSVGLAFQVSNSAANNTKIATLSLAGGLPQGTGTWSIDTGASWDKVRLSGTTGLSVELRIDDSNGLDSGDNGAKTIVVEYDGEGLVSPLSITLTCTVVALSTFWAGPHSKLPWYSGGYSRLSQLDALRLNPATGKKRRLDVLTTFHRRGGWSVWGTPAATSWKLNPGLWYGWLLSDDTPAVNIAMQPFCSDPGLPGASDPNNTLATWPAKGSIPLNAWIAPNRPVGYQQSGLTNAQKRERHMDVWQHMVDGHFDHIWEPKLTEFKNAIPVLASKRIIWRPWWETNILGGAGVGGGLWGHVSSQRVSSPLGGMRTAADIALVKQAYKHFNDLIRGVFPNNSWFHWNPLRNTVAASAVWPAPEPSYGNTMDLIDPLQWDFIGPDFYDRDDIGGNTGPGLPGGGTYEERWNQIAFAGSQAAPKGIVRWFEWLRNVARPINPNVLMGIGEWGVWRLATDHQGTAGDDDAYYIEKMYDLMAANSDVMGYEAYYNNRKSDGTEETMLTVAGGGTFFPNASAMYKTKWATLT